MKIKKEYYLLKAFVYIKTRETRQQIWFQSYLARHCIDFFCRFGSGSFSFWRILSLTPDPGSCMLGHYYYHGYIRLYFGVQIAKIKVDSLYRCRVFIRYEPDTKFSSYPAIEHFTLVLGKSWLKFLYTAGYLIRYPVEDGRNIFRISRFSYQVGCISGWILNFISREIWNI